MRPTEILNNKFCNKSVAVLGIGVSNTPVIDLLLKLGAKVTACDKKSKEQLGSVALDLEEKGVELSLGDGYLDSIVADYIFRSPGIRPDEAGILAAVANGSVLTSEMQEFFDVCPCKIIAVTGSDGKTTTTTLISEILSDAGYTVHLGGNIGRPLLPVVDSICENDFAVVELSSFQLQTMRKSPDIAVITNITPNHLNWHIDMREYIDAKLNIARYQSENSKIVVNYEDKNITENSEVFVSMIRHFSSKRILTESDSVCEYDGHICFDGVPVLNVSDIKIPGRHNVENYMAAIAATADFVNSENIVNVAKNFGGVEHRGEFVRELDGVKYYNSSIDSSPTRTIAALNSFNQKLIVLCGGSDKHISYEPLGEPLCDRAKAVIVTGQTAGYIKEAVMNCSKYDAKQTAVIEAKDYSEAVEIANNIAKSGDIVILSPASASFDCFKNFEERGKFFKNEVNKLKSKRDTED